ncbi:MAG: hypothetical protein ACREC3_04370 [Methyloceanibacter sp.]
MRFELTAARNPYLWGDLSLWQVERILGKHDRYVVARFRNQEDAQSLMKLIKRSVEVEDGAEVVCA